MVLTILIAGIRPERVFDFGLENVCVTACLLALFASYRKLPLSDFSYVLILGYLILHEYGAHYKYSDVPMGEWMKPWLHSQRNSYDRVVHFSFGLLLSYPFQEVFIRAVRVTGPWRYYLPVETTLCFSAVYEMLEAGAASILSPERGEEFVGMQGDIWDSQEDMLMATLGAIVTMMILYWWRKRRSAHLAVEAAERVTIGSK